MTQPPGEATPDPASPARARPRRAARRAMPWPRRLARALVSAMLALVLFVGGLAGVAVLASGRPVVLPVWAVAETEARMNRALDGRAQVSLGGAAVVFGAGRLPELRVFDLRIGRPEEGGAILLPEVQARFAAAPLLQGRIAPVAVRVSGAQLALRRGADGRIDWDLGPAASQTPGSLADLLARIDAFFAQPALATLDRIDAEALSLTLDDRRSGRVWTVGDGRVTLIRDAQETILDAALALVGGGSALSSARVILAAPHGGQGARIEARVEAVAAADIAAQTPLLGWLGVLDAPISGDLRAGLSADGTLARLDGALSVGTGALHPVQGARPVPLKAAEIVFAWDPARARITASRVHVDSPALRLTAQAHADLTGMEDGVPDSFLAQLRFADVLVNPDGVFAEPVRFGAGALDMRLRLDPFTVELGQLALVEDGRHLGARGKLAAAADGWRIDLDLGLDAIRHDRLLALWPVGLVPNTREWLRLNVHEGVLSDVRAGLRLRPGEEPKLSLGYDFADADVRFMPTLPPIQGASGYAGIDGRVYTLVVAEGHVTPPQGGRISVARSVFRVPDINKIPADAEITLETDSSMTAALSLLDQPPFGFLGKAGLSPDLGEGHARLTTELRLPLVRQLRLADVDFLVLGRITDVRTDRLVPGRSLAAPVLEVRADPEAVVISGKGLLGQAAFDARWRLPLGPDAGPGGVRGTVTLDSGFGAEFLSGLGRDVLAGEGRAAIEIDLPRQAAPVLRLTSDLAGVTLRLADIGWTKPAAGPGKLELQGTLAAPVRFDRLLLEGAGLRAEGTLQLDAGGGLERLALSRFRLGDWLDARGEVEGRGAGRPVAVRLTGGSADLRRMPGAGVPLPASGGAAQGGPIAVALDSVRVTAGIALTGVSATLTPRRGGVEGRFAGSLNGKAAVRGELLPGPRGTAVKVSSADGGAVLAAAGLFAKARGGALEAVFNPTGSSGHYDGSLTLRDFRVREMPALAELLNAVSIVGLLDQLGSSGLAFSEAEGRFRITPRAAELSQGRAVGASFGVSLEGVYHTAEDRLDLRGVLSPFYLINGVGAVLTRPGEGLVGFTYRVRGTAAAPRVTVNPLSVLAPGFFREMFRRPAARLDVP